MSWDINRDRKFRLSLTGSLNGCDRGRRLYVMARRSLHKERRTWCWLLIIADVLYGRPLLLLSGLLICGWPFLAPIDDPPTLTATIGPPSRRYGTLVKFANLQGHLEILLDK